MKELFHKRSSSKPKSRLINEYNLFFCHINISDTKMQNDIYIWYIHTDANLCTNTWMSNKHHTLMNEIHLLSLSWPNIIKCIWFSFLLVIKCWYWDNLAVTNRLKHLKYWCFTEVMVEPCTVMPKRQVFKEQRVAEGLRFVKKRERKIAEVFNSNISQRNVRRDLHISPLTVH